ncbi:transmembrane repetitive protein [Lysobacter koreensis]|uniref:Transmembrane repetitive protein n=1 Tax=Lysobacter koreensis TaxID=266122 RepID=A0ABW2YIF4_9GAMM
MVSAAELIEALQRRMQLVAPHRRRLPGEFPPGWQAWLGAMHERAGAVTGATAAAITDTFLQRPLTSPPRRALLLTRWQAFTTLWRQEWHPPARDERKLRWFAGSVSALWHVFFGVMLLWLMYLKYLGFTPAPEGDTVVQVEYIGVGTPAEVGGGPDAAPPSPAEQAETADASSATSESPPSPTASVAPADMTPSLSAPLPDVAQRDVPEPQVPAPSVEQPVAVSEPTRSQDPVVFVLPPPTPRVSEPNLATRDLSAPTREVRAIDVPEPVQPLQRELPQPEVTPRPIQARIPQVTTREVPAPLQRAPVRELPQRPLAPPELRSTTPPVQARQVPTPAARAPVASASVSQPAPSSSSTPSRAATAPSSIANSARSASAASRAAAAAPPTASSAGAGPKPTATPGSWPTPTRADDWGDSARNRPGAQRGVRPGVFNADGSVKLAETPGSASPGLPPGTIEARITDLDRAGTWLKRKPNDYEPTTLDKYWRPNETLLAEWVRKSVTTVRIPIPGTSKTIVCQTVMLALGGGCGISDPNLNEQPATARPPPDIPFKPELQEDNGSVKPAG